MSQLSEVDILKAALYTACAQLAWNQNKRGQVAHIVHSAKDCMAMVSRPEEAERTQQKIQRMNRT